MSTTEFVNPRVAAKHAKREENKRKALEKRAREKENKVLRKALGNPQKLFDDLQEANNVIARLTASVNEEADANAKTVWEWRRANERVEDLLADKAAHKAEVAQLLAERNAAKAMLDAKERAQGFLPLAAAYVEIQKLKDELASMRKHAGEMTVLQQEATAQLGEQRQVLKTEVEKGQKLWDKVQQLEAECDGLKVDLADALGKPARAPLVMHAGAEQPVRIPPLGLPPADRLLDGLPALQPGDEAEAG